ncbi:MAG: DUF998 domain-containing protein [Ornithinimicrobium sp.]|uniref:DUF998 domain-containing protein n=1 Tax=Ornithinimicrobium sp. TaxID=1977084 RepID=UPI0018402316|nr:DUF998 domain-containing protein [Actinomycetota bacterium]
MRPSNRRRVAACCWAAGAQYFAAELVTAAGWRDPAYDWARNFVSDLGARTAGVNEGRVVSSPRHAVMNVSFVTLGVLTPAGAWLFAPYVPHRGWRRVAVGLAGVHGLGIAGVGLQPTEPGVGEMRRAVHYFAAACAIGGGNLLLLAASVGLAPTRRRQSVLTGVVGAVASAASATMLLSDVRHPGIVERIAGWPVTLWTTATGIVVLLEDLAEQAAD